MSDNDSNDSDVARIANQGDSKDRESDSEKEKEKIINVGNNLDDKINVNIIKDSLIEKTNKENKDSKEIDSNQQKSDDQIEIAKLNLLQIKEKKNEDNNSDASGDSNLIEIANQQQNESSSSSSDEKKTEKEDKEKTPQIKEKEVITLKDSIMEDKEILHSIPEPKERKDNNSSNIANTTLTLNNYKLDSTNNEEINRNNFFKSNNSNNPRQYRENDNNNYYKSNANFNNARIESGSNYNNRPSFNYQRQYNNNFNYSHNYRQSEKVDYDPLYKENRLLIHEIIQYFPSFSDVEIVRIIKTINQGPKQTMFEIMNHLFREHAITKANKAQQLMHNQRKFEDIIDINETSYPEDLIANHLRILKQYKIFTKPQCIAKDIPEEYAYNSNKDQRRLLKKDIDGNYNYIPRESNNSNNSQPNPNDFYSLNQTEMNYHSLVFHTRLCRKRECNELICPNAHSLSSDFRIIYDYKKQDTCILMNNITNSKMITVIESYLEHFAIPTCFNLNDFKIFKCELVHKLDRHLCPLYHDVYEKRRPPEIFRYSNNSCPQALFKDNYEPSRCKSGDYCNDIHSKYEYNYQKDNFRRQFNCDYEKKGVCPYHKTCYGIHRKTYGDLDIDFELTKAKMMISNVVLCKICNQLPNGLKYVFYTPCRHYCCEDCFKKSVKEEKCLVCCEHFNKKQLMRMFFT